jgi:hypothetical protein
MGSHRFAVRTRTTAQDMTMGADMMSAPIVGGTCCRQTNSMPPSISGDWPVM